MSGCIHTCAHKSTNVVCSSDHSKNNSIVSEQDTFARIHLWTQLNDIHANFIFVDIYSNKTVHTVDDGFHLETVIYSTFCRGKGKI